MQGGAEHIARGVARTGQLSVGIAALDDETAQVEGIFHDAACALDGDALLGAELRQQLGILFFLGVVARVDDGGLCDVLKVVLGSEFFDFFGVAQENEVGNALGEDTVGSFQSAFFRAFGENDALLVGFCFCNELFNQCHKIILGS